MMVRGNHPQADCEFEVGDVVTVRIWDELLAEYPRTEYGGIQVHPYVSFAGGMRDLCGKKFVISDITSETDIPVRIFLRRRACDVTSDLSWTFTPEMFEPKAPVATISSEELLGILNL